MTKVDILPEFSKLDFLAFQRAFRLPNRTVTALSKIPKSHWPTARQLEYFEKKLIEELGGFTQTKIDDVEMIWIADPLKVFMSYIKNLRDSVWGGNIPNPLTLVVSGDKGSETTKFGLFVPNDVPNAQSPYNFRLMSMYEGAETGDLIQQANKVFFDFINSIIEDGGLDMDFGNGPDFISIKVLFVSDLKMMPLIFAVDHSSSKTFCPFCSVKRDEHQESACSGDVRQLKEAALLNVPISNMVCPPLHILQGLLNKVLEVIDETKRKKLLKAAKVKSSYRKSSLLTGRDGQKFLKFVVDNPEKQVDYRTTLTKLYELSQWASVKTYKRLSKDKDSLPERLKSTVSEFSESWRKDKFSAINKLHLVESHLSDFILLHSGWGVYGDQAIESLHHLGNVATKCCFGINKNKALKFSMKVHLVLAIFASQIFRMHPDDESDSSDSGEESSCSVEE